ncbi:MAG: hypothetical protein ACJ74W_11720 [Pyrinomonadaceae bacterium]
MVALTVKPLLKVTPLAPEIVELPLKVKITVLLVVSVPLLDMFPLRVTALAPRVRVLPVPVLSAPPITMFPVYPVVLYETVPAPLVPIEKLPLTVNAVEPDVVVSVNAPDVLSRLRLPKVRPATDIAGVRVELPRKIILLAGSNVATPSGVAALEAVL